MSSDRVAVWWSPTLREWRTYCGGCGWQAGFTPAPSQHVWPSPLWTLPRAHDAAAAHVAEHRCRDPYSWMRWCERRGDYAGFNAAFAVAGEAARERWRHAEPVWPVHPPDRRTP